ncbi:hypothetical protein [Nesterenkonia muleiensis]|uniref:hypothetical protein n=1 Tax=Nesterenkonia muleiensis TaxID=2282648 RepID=UPI000E76E657|nr:hypothetical protein [Nesterenkonia muleiensis]
MTALLSEEHQVLAESVREFAEQVIAPVSVKHDAEHGKTQTQPSAHWWGVLLKATVRYHPASPRGGVKV